MDNSQRGNDKVAEGIRDALVCVVSVYLVVGVLALLLQIIPELVG